MRPIDIKAKLLDMMVSKAYVTLDDAAEALGVDEREVFMEIKSLEKKGEVVPTDKGYAFPEQYRKDEKTRAGYRGQIQIWSQY